jgi:hypothetical protein
VHVEVDEAWHHGFTGGVDYTRIAWPVRRAGWQNPADAISDDYKCALACGSASAVDDAAAFYHDDRLGCSGSFRWEWHATRIIGRSRGRGIEKSRAIRRLVLCR